VRWCDELEEDVTQVICRNWRLNAKSREEWWMFAVMEEEEEDNNTHHCNSLKCCKTGCNVFYDSGKSYQVSCCFR
jgi:hypothetical protein